MRREVREAKEGREPAREAIAEENRKDIIERLWKGRQERVRRGLPPGGNLPYGYQRNGEGLAHHPEEAEIVRLIFELRARDQNASDIAQELNARGSARRNGRPWTRRQVAAIRTRKAFYHEGVIQYGEVKGQRRDLALLKGEALPTA